MESRYLSRRSQKVREHIERFIAGRQRLYGDDYFTKEYLIEDIKRIFNAMIIVREKFKKEHSDSDLEQRLKGYFPNWTTSIGETAYDYIFFERMINDNLGTFCDGLYTTQRILFLGDKYSSFGFGGTTDPYHVNHARNFFDSLVIHDDSLIQAYLTQLPGPFRAGYPFYLSFVNSTYLILQSKLREASGYLDRRTKMKTLTSYERFILLAVKAIADKDGKKFVSEVSHALKLYPRQHFHHNLVDYLSLEALSLYNLAGKILGKTPTEPNSEYWDHELFVYSNDPPQRPRVLIDFSKLLPLFAKWIEELPPELTMTDLIKDIENSKSSW